MKGGGARFWFESAARCAVIAGAFRVAGRPMAARHFTRLTIYRLSFGFKYLGIAGMTAEQKLSVKI